MHCPHGYMSTANCDLCLAITRHLENAQKTIMGRAISGLMNELSCIRQSGEFADITIKCGGTEIKAHSLIISAGSEFFRAACRGPWKEAQTGVIEMPEDDSKVMTALLKFMYTGNYDLDKKIEDNCVEACRGHSEICFAAKKYNIKFLPELAECRLKQTAWKSS